MNLQSCPWPEYNNFSQSYLLLEHFIGDRLYRGMSLLKTSIPYLRTFSPAADPRRLFHTTLLRTLYQVPKIPHHRPMSSSNSRPTSPSNAEVQLKPPPVTFPISPVPPNPLGEGKYIKTAAALIIGWVPKPVWDISQNVEAIVIQGWNIEWQDSWSELPYLRTILLWAWSQFVRLCAHQKQGLYWRVQWIETRKRIEVIADDEGEMCVISQCRWSIFWEIVIDFEPELKQAEG